MGGLSAELNLHILWKIRCQSMLLHSSNTPFTAGDTTKFFLENFCIMGYNLKNARNNKSASNIPRWTRLRRLELKNKFIQQFEFLEYLEGLYGKDCGRARSCSPTTFSIQIIFYSKLRLS